MPFSKDALLKDHVGQDDISGFLAEGTEIHGEVRFRDVLRVDGKITGKVISEKELVVGESGEIEADVNVGILSVSGKITGTIHVKEKLEIHPTGRVLGDLNLCLGVRNCHNRLGVAGRNAALLDEPLDRIW